MEWWGKAGSGVTEMMETEEEEEGRWSVEGKGMVVRRSGDSGGGGKAARW